MRLLVIGGSRGVGRQVTIEALNKGHIVTVFSRHPSDVEIKHPNLSLQVGNVLDASTLEMAITNIDAVICTLGLTTRQAIGPPLSRPSYLLLEGTSNILKAMKSAHIKRLICVTAFGTNESIKQCSLAAKLILRRGLRWQYKEKDKQEQLIKHRSDIVWTIIRPTSLTNAKKRNNLASNKIRTGIFTHISRTDVAGYMVDILDDKSTYNQSYTLSYLPKFGDSLRYTAGIFGII